MDDSTPEVLARPAWGSIGDAAEAGRGRNATAPWTIPPLGWKDILWRTWRGAGRQRLGSLAGGVTFYLLLATFPALAAFVSIYGLFLDLAAVERQVEALSQVFPQDAVNLIEQEMVRLASQRHADLSATLLGSALISLWSANAGMKALFDGLNVACGEVEKRPYLRRTAITFAATLGCVAFLAAVTSLTVAAPVFRHTLGLHKLRVWFAPIRWLLVYLMAAAVFSLVYRYGPSRAPAKWRWVVCGGAGGALFWMVGSIGFSTYLNNFTHFGATYGSLGAMLGFMLWVWFSVMVFLFGATFNAEIEHQTAQDTTHGPSRPIGARGAVMADTIGEAFTVSPRQAHDYVLRFIARQAQIVARMLLRGRRP
jgi:membrane protein